MSVTYKILLQCLAEALSQDTTSFRRAGRDRQGMELTGTERKTLIRLARRSRQREELPAEQPHSDGLGVVAKVGMQREPLIGSSVGAELSTRTPNAV